MLGVFELSLFITLSGVLSLLFVAFTVWKILKQDEGTEKMKEISNYIREGASAYLKRQYSIIAIIATIIAACIAIFVNPLMAISYVIGAACSAATGFIGLNIAVRSNSRTANAAKTQGLSKALELAFKGGSVLSFGIIGIGLLGVMGVFALFGGLDAATAPSVVNQVIGFSFGASTVALFARVGGGIFTKAADIGADLVGKVEAHIPEDDARNPGVIADNVGDNVGDVAGMGADLFESYVGSIIATMILGAVLPEFQSVAGIPNMEWVLLPLVIAGIGIITSIFTSFTVRGSPEKALTRATVIATILTAGATFFVLSAIFGLGLYETLTSGVFISLLAGLVTGVIIGQTSNYFTSGEYRPTKITAEASEQGPALTILKGFSMGHYSVVIPIIVIAIAEMIAFLSGGVYGVAISAVGMLSIIGIVIAADAYGPITDNAAGIAEQAKLDPKVREITDKLDAVGNTMKSICKGFANGSAALTAIAFFFTIVQLPAFTEYAAMFAGGQDALLSLLNTQTFAGILIGAAMPPFFTAVVVLGVSNGADRMVKEIRRQFRQIPGLMEGTAKPDYARCVKITTDNAIKQLILPGAAAILAPIIVGLTLGPSAMIGMVAGAIITGLLLGLFMGNVGNTWDNAKKYVESGQFGGKGSPAHAAAVIGDTVGDPMKDAAGPGQNIFIKLMSVTTIVFLPIIIQFFI